MKGLIIAGVLFASVIRVHAEPGDVRYLRQDFSSQIIANGGRSYNQTTGTIVGTRSPTCINAATRGRLTCGCELSLKLFGKIIPDLMLASNWRRMFAPTPPANGAVAVRPGHVLLVLNHVGGTVYQVWDPNSGGGKTRIHERNLAGWSFVNPNSSRTAMR
jgi:hypothetical protein